MDNFAEEKEPMDMTPAEAGKEYQELWNSPKPGETESMEGRQRRLDRMQLLYQVANPKVVDKDLDFELSGSMNRNLYNALHDSYGGEEGAMAAIERAEEALQDHVEEDAIQKAVRAIKDKVGDKKAEELISNAQAAVGRFFSDKDKAYLEESGLGNDPDLIQALGQVGELMRWRKDRREREKKIENKGTFLTGFKDNDLPSKEEAREMIKVIMALPNHPYWDGKHPEHKQAVAEWGKLHRIAYGKD